MGWTLWPTAQPGENVMGTGEIKSRMDLGTKIWQMLQKTKECEKDGQICNAVNIASGKECAVL